MITITLAQARHFLLKQQFLDPPRSITGKEGVLAMFQRLGCIQYDPVNIVGHNPELVLQARVAGYTPALLDELLYNDRLLWDGLDKVMSIYLAQDWPFFARRRADMAYRYGGDQNAPMQLAEMVTQTIRNKGPHSSIDFEQDARTDWHWGGTRLVRATLESLYFMGRLGIHHRSGTRRFFDLVENLLPAEVLNTPDPNPTLEDYQDWHILRRIGGLGLAHPGAGEQWLAILGAQARERQAAIQRLIQRGLIEQISISELPRLAFYARTCDLPLLDTQPNYAPERAVFLAPLDNFLWDRRRLKWLFDFEYIWEVYKPAAQRKYGHYTLPVLFGDRFIARFDPIFNRKAGCLTIKNWWWEANIQPHADMRSAIREAVTAFASYLDAHQVVDLSGQEFA